jgi:hypothetical protein
MEAMDTRVREDWARESNAETTKEKNRRKVA